MEIISSLKQICNDTTDGLGLLEVGLVLPHRTPLWVVSQCLDWQTVQYFFINDNSARLICIFLLERGPVLSVCVLFVGSLKRDTGCKVGIKVVVNVKEASRNCELAFSIARHLWRETMETLSLLKQRCNDTTDGLGLLEERLVLPYTDLSLG
jgi:hypothetical protein